MTEQVIPIIVALLGGTGIVGGIYALLKLRPEAGQIVVSAAEGAVVVQSGVIKNLTAELRRYEQEVHRYREENQQLRDRIAGLERELRELREALHLASKPPPN